MKQRILVMNQQRVLQAEEAGVWKTKKVYRAGTLKPGIYNLYLATQADKSQRYDGTILHMDTNTIYQYQDVDKNFVTHARSDFDRVLEIGERKSIRYDAQGQAIVSAAIAKVVTRSRSR